MDWLPYPQRKPKNLQHCLISVKFLDSQGKSVENVWSAIYTVAGGFQCIPHGDHRLLPVTGCAKGLKVLAFVPYPAPYRSLDDEDLLS